MSWIKVLRLALHGPSAVSGEFRRWKFPQSCNNKTINSVLTQWMPLWQLSFIFHFCPSRTDGGPLSHKIHSSSIFFLNKMSTIFWDITSMETQPTWLPTCFHADILLGIFDPQDEVVMYLRNICWLSTDYTALYSTAVITSNPTKNYSKSVISSANLTVFSVFKLSLAVKKNNFTND
jgi:hypothetical protein